MEIEKELKVGKVYRVTHARKGTFIAQLIGVEQGDPGDEHDTIFLTMKYDVRAGTGQVGLAVNPGKDAFRVSNLRPSLIIKIEEVEAKDWNLEATPIKDLPRPDNDLIKAMRELTEAVKNKE